MEDLEPLEGGRERKRLRKEQSLPAPRAHVRQRGANRAPVRGDEVAAVVRRPDPVTLVGAAVDAHEHAAVGVPEVDDDLAVLELPGFVDRTRALLVPRRDPSWRAIRAEREPRERRGRLERDAERAPAPDLVLRLAEALVRR
jgi:hypothetical protein